MLNMMQWMLGWVKSNAKLLVKPNKNFLPLRTFIERGCEKVLRTEVLLSVVVMKCLLCIGSSFSFTGLNTMVVDTTNCSVT
jgi:hypothetical protein